jgi:hypothetical protein
MLWARSYGEWLVGCVLTHWQSDFTFGAPPNPFSSGTGNGTSNTTTPAPWHALQSKNALNSK